MLQESNQLRSLSNNSSLDNKLLIEFCGATQLLGIEDDRLPAEDEYDDCDLDPALKEKIDRWGGCLRAFYSDPSAKKFFERLKIIWIDTEFEIHHPQFEFIVFVIWVDFLISNPTIWTQFFRIISFGMCTAAKKVLKEQNNRHIQIGTVFCVLWSFVW